MYTSTKQMKFNIESLTKLNIFANPKE